jgi:hypothetical protein
MQRGRKSAAALATFPVDGKPTLLRPPASLSEAQRAVFVATVTAVRPEHFQPCDLPLLVRYCEIVAMCDHVGKKLAADNETPKRCDVPAAPWPVEEGDPRNYC